MEPIFIIHRVHSFSAFLSNQKKKLLRLCIKFLKNRDGLPKFWVIFSDPICRDLLVNGYYERELLDGMQLLARNRKGIAIDAGANIGNHTVYFSQTFPRVVSFEPGPANCLILKANLYLNRIRNVTLVEKALGAQETTVLLGGRP